MTKAKLNHLFSKTVAAWSMPNDSQEENNLTTVQENSSCYCRPPRPPYPPCRPCRPCPPCPSENCKASGQLLQNPGMEAFTLGVPTGWTTTTSNLVSRVTAQGRVHSGNSAVNLGNSANLSQIVSGIQSGCYYEFSFFARGTGANVALTATVTFIANGVETQGAFISINAQDIPISNRSYGYYRTLTIAAPANATTARITFTVSASGGQSLDLDDVSFALQ